MAKLKLSKSALAQQREQLKLYRKLLPSLDLKRRQLSVELEKARQAYEEAQSAVDSLETKIGRELPMLASPEMELSGLVKLTDVLIVEENVVGVRMPALESIAVEVAPYSHLAKPAWVDMVAARLRDAAEQRLRAKIAGERVLVLTKAVRRITQRVNLFERILIPTAKRSIQRIQIFLGDAERAAVSRSKMAKAKQHKQRATLLDGTGQA